MAVRVTAVNWRFTAVNCNQGGGGTEGKAEACPLSWNEASEAPRAQEPHPRRGSGDEARWRLVAGPSARAPARKRSDGAERRSTGRTPSERRESEGGRPQPAPEGSRRPGGSKWFMYSIDWMLNWFCWLNDEVACLVVLPLLCQTIRHDAKRCIMQVAVHACFCYVQAVGEW